MQGLVSLPRFTRISPGLVTILGMNPSKMSLQGTNTYLLGTGASRVLIDTGSGNLQYRANLTSVLYMEQVKDLSHVLFTHYHHDHVGGLYDVLSALYFTNLVLTSSTQPLTPSLIHNIYTQTFSPCTPRFLKYAPEHPLAGTYTYTPETVVQDTLDIETLLTHVKEVNLELASRLDAVQSIHKDFIDTLGHNACTTTLVPTSFPFLNITDGQILRYNTQTHTYTNIEQPTTTTTNTNTNTNTSNTNASPNTHMSDRIQSLQPLDMGVFHAPGHTDDHVTAISKVVPPLYGHVHVDIDPNHPHIPTSPTIPSHIHNNTHTNTNTGSSSSSSSNTSSTEEEVYVFFSGDAVLGQSSSVIINLDDALRTLRTHADVFGGLTAHKRVLLPAHGQAGEDAYTCLQDYITNREERIKQVEWVLVFGTMQGYGEYKTDPATKIANIQARYQNKETEYMTCVEIVHQVYRNLQPELVPVAAQNTMLVLQMMEKEGVVCVDTSACSSSSSSTDDTSHTHTHGQTHAQPTTQSTQSIQTQECKACAQATFTYKRHEFMKVIRERKYKILKNYKLIPDTYTTSNL